MDEKSAGQDGMELERMVSRSEEKFSAHAIVREEELRQEMERLGQKRQQHHEKHPALHLSL